MTRYSRSVIPGRPAEDDSESLDRVVFGAKKKPIAPPANDADRDYPDPMDMDVDEAGFLVERSDKNRRGANGDRRKRPERRKEDGRRQSDYAPLRENGAARRSSDAGNRGPILLVGALVIVAVFGVVVWNAYREGVRTDDPETALPQLAAAGAFKTPPREIVDVPAAGAEAADVLEQLEGGPAPVSTSPPEVRVEPKPVAPAPVQTAVAAPAPAPSKVTAMPPAPLKAPVVAPPVVVASKPAAPLAAAAIVTPSSPAIELPKPSAAVAPAAKAPAVASPDGYKPAFAAGGSWLVQIAATSSEAGAISEWDRRAKAWPELLSAAERFVIQADVNGKTVYRLRAGPFAAKADAEAFCTAFKAKGGNCLPAAK